MATEQFYSDNKKEELISILTDELPTLRAKIAITQEELSEIIGISRQTYNSIETKRRKMNWNSFLSLIMFFVHNENTAPIIEVIGAFPDDLKEALNVNKR